MKDADYLNFIRSLRCSVANCMVLGCEAHHRIGHNRREDYANKASDYEAVPLCKCHHDELHNHGWRSFETKYKYHQLKESIKCLGRYIQFMYFSREAPI